MPEDREKRREALRRYRARKHAEKFGPDAGDMRGRHGNHSRGPANYRWNAGIYRSTGGYIMLAVPIGHHLRQAHGYAYEHDLIMEEIIGRPLDTATEIVHHLNGARADNRLENLVLETRSAHAREHAAAPGARDALGQFTSGLRIRQLPGGAA